MTVLHAGYESNNSGFKSLNLAARNEAFKIGYLSHIRSNGAIQDGDQVLELGCGQGHKLKTMIHGFKSATFKGLEFSPEMLKKAQKRLPNTELVLGDMTIQENIPEDIDVACYFQSLHHLSEEKRGETAEAIHQRLPPKGKAIVIDSFDPNEIAQRMYAVLSQYPGNKLAQSYHSMRSLIHPGEYDPVDYGYFPISHHNALGPEQEKLFTIEACITPFFGKAISDILILEKR